MEFFGITSYGPQNFFKDIMAEEYKEPMNNEEVKQLMERLKNTTCPANRPDVEIVRRIDCYIRMVNGFPYGSANRFCKMKQKGVIKPVGPSDMYRLPPTTYTDLGWWQCDPVLENETWFLTIPRYPQPASPYTLILDKARRNDKYASLY